MSASDQCPICEHYQGLGKCEAFPDGIPSEIATGDVDHTEPYPGDHGIQYKQIARAI